jgi:glutathionylspermidine synthase
MHAPSFHDAVERLDRSILGDPRLGPDYFAELTRRQRDEGLLHGDRPICPYLRPFMLARSRYEAVARAAAVLSTAFERVAERALVDDTLMAELGMTEAEATMARVDPKYRRLCVSSRLDAFFTDEGFKFIEYNAESPAGLSDQALLEGVLCGPGHVRDFLDTTSHWRPEPHERILDALLVAYREWGGTEERPFIAIVDWTGVPTESEFFILKRAFERRGYESVVADPNALVYEDGRLRVDGRPIDILYKRVIIHELLDRHGVDHPICRAVRDGVVCMANSFRAKLVHKKASLAVLGDPRHAWLFDDVQLEAIRAHIPWTRTVRRGTIVYDGEEWDFVDLLRRRRERLVLKPNDDYGGSGVVVGAATTAAAWEAAVERALGRNYVAQERVAVRRQPMPAFSKTAAELVDVLVDFDPFLFHGEVDGGLVRLSSTVLCNVSSGGGETALVVLEGV